MPVPDQEYGDDWLECIEYTGPGAKDPTGGILPQDFNWVDLALKAVVFRNHKAVEIAPEEIQKNDKIVKAIIDEELIKQLYEGDPEAIRLEDAAGKEFTRLGWYIKYGRDGVRTLVTGRLKLHRGK